MSTPFILLNQEHIVWVIAEDHRQPEMAAVNYSAK
jgi:hypothetical protein